MNEITTEIAEALGKEQDEPLKRVIANKVDAWRSTLIVRSLQKHPEERKFFTQTVYVPMVLANEIPCPTPFNACQVAKSKLYVPKPMRLGNELFEYVGSIDGQNPFKEAAVGTSQFLAKGRWMQKVVFWEYENKSIRIRGNDLTPYTNRLPMIRIDGVFDNPRAVMAYNCRNNQGNCDYWDNPYPVTGDIKQMIVQYILQVDYGMKPTNDSVPEVEVAGNEPIQYAKAIRH